MRCVTRPFYTVALLLAGAAAWVAGQPAVAEPSASATQQASSAKRAPVIPAASGPAWTELSRSQQAALAPLASSWSGMVEAHKRKWIALSSNYGRLEPAEQAKLHGRMTEWAALSPQQRAQARLNFAETRELTAEEKKAKWEAYQALSEDEKRKLAEQAKPRPKGAALAVRPVSPQKLAVVPAPAPSVRHPARIASEVRTTPDPHELMQTATDAPSTAASQ